MRLYTTPGGVTGIRRAYDTGNAFVFTVKTTGSPETFALPLEAGGTYDFVVDWGDAGSDRISTWNSAAATHSYATAGTYVVIISGVIQGWRFNNLGDKDKVYDIRSWGSLRLGNNNGYFYGCSNLTVNATDILDLTSTTTLQSIFRSCTALITVPSINDWNTALITAMNYTFLNSVVFNQDINAMDVSAVTSMRLTFQGATSFNQDISGWDITSLTDATSMFSGVTLSTANYDALLIGWEGQVEQPNVTFHGGNSKYSAGAATTAKAALVANGWVITDGGAA